MLLRALIACSLLGAATSARLLQQGPPQGLGPDGLALPDVAATDPPRWRQHPRVPFEALVKFSTASTPAERGRALGRAGAEVLGVAADGEEGKLVLVRIPAVAGRSTGQAAQLIEGDDAVEYAEPNFLYTSNAVSNDGYFTNGNLWGMYGDTVAPKNSFGSQAAEAWANGQTGSRDVWIGIIDEGVFRGHEDLAANMGTNPGEIPGNGIDDDGNGYVDDVNGWDFNANDKEPFKSASDDHGTHVAGTVGGVGGNGRGVAGVAWAVKMMSAKFLDGSTGSGSLYNAVRAVDYITQLKKLHSLNFVATSNSWSGGGYSQALKDAIDRAAAADILFICAAGNSGINVDATPTYPCSYTSSNVICVGGIQSNGAIYSASNYGAQSVDIAAPAVGVYSTVPAYSKRTKQYTSAYASYSGTSMATPHVSGAAALYAAHHPGATAAQIKAAIMLSAVPTASVSGKCVTNGRLDVARMMQQPLV